MKYTTDQITVNKLGGLDKLEKEEIAVMILNESIKAGQWQSFSIDDLNLLWDERTFKIPMLAILLSKEDFLSALGEMIVKDEYISIDNMTFQLRASEKLIEKFLIN